MVYLDHRLYPYTEERTATAFKDQRQRWTRVTAQCEPGDGQKDRQGQTAAYYCASFFRVEWEKHSSCILTDLTMRREKRYYCSLITCACTNSYIHTHTHICRLYVYIDTHIHMHIHTGIQKYT